jgi:hypothetical protein
MKKIKVIKNGVVTNINENQATSDEAKAEWLAQEIANGSFGKSERWVSGLALSDEEKASALATREVSHHGEATITEYKLAAEYEVVEEDMTAEIAAKEAEEADQAQTRNFLKGLKKSDLTDVDKCASAIMKIIKHLRADK